MNQPISPIRINDLIAAFGERLQENVRLENYTTAHVGGVADAFLIVYSAKELEDAARILWQSGMPFYVIGSGSNVLVSDKGVRAVILLNRAKTIKVDTHKETPTIWVESGANLGYMARQIALRGLSSLEWAAGIPGTVGGALYGNAGAHGSDMSKHLVLAEILHRGKGKESWTLEQMGYGYRTSLLKRNPGECVLLAARLKVQYSSIDAVKAKMAELAAKRRQTQPPGASMGSMFKNPSGDYAGRLIEAAGLKGARVGGALISKLHANFFINDNHATAADIWTLVKLARKTVLDKFGIALELEIELLGEWDEH